MLGPFDQKKMTFVKKIVLKLAFQDYTNQLLT